MADIHDSVSAYGSNPQSILLASHTGTDLIQAVVPDQQSVLQFDSIISNSQEKCPQAGEV